MNSNNSFCVLVTGATGFLGNRIVANLLGSGFKVRILARKTSRLNQFDGLDVDIVFGDLGDLESLVSAFVGIDYVVHAAADTSGTVEGGKAITIEGTRNILGLCKKFKIKKLVYISSCSVYGIVDHAKGDSVTEESPVERMPEKRGAYSNAKFQAEQIVLAAISKADYPVVCLRPGTIYGPEGEIYTPMMGFSFRNRFFLTIDKGQFVMPLVYVDNVADAIRAVLETKASDGQVYNIIDSYRLTKTAYIDLFLKRIYPRALFFNLPYGVLYFIVYIQEILFKILHKPAFLTRYRLESSQKEIVYAGEKICRQLNWIAPVGLDEAMNRMIKYELEKL